MTKLRITVKDGEGAKKFISINVTGTDKMKKKAFR